MRTCTHIKTNGIKCGSPALRHHTMCYFHYQWMRRGQRRIRIGGPAGTNRNTGIELPLLDGPQSILLAIMEVQNALLDRRIETKEASVLLYSLQLALQAKLPYTGLSDPKAVTECPELDFDLELERAKGQRPAKEKCARCPTAETCTSPRHCKKLPKRAPAFRSSDGSMTRSPDSPIPSLCHPERSTVVSCEAEGPFVSPPEARDLNLLHAPEEKQKALRLRANSTRSAQADTELHPKNRTSGEPENEERTTNHEKRGTNGERRTENGQPVFPPPSLTPTNISGKNLRI